MGAGRRSATCSPSGGRNMAISRWPSASSIDDVKQVADPQGRGRQYLASRLEKLAGTRMAGFVLTRQVPVGKWGKATYALKKTAEEGDHRGHRGHRVEEQRFDYSDGAQADAKVKVL